MHLIEVYNDRALIKHSALLTIKNYNFVNAICYEKAVRSFPNRLFCRFRTPTLRRSIMECSPRTPTPFKTALTLQDTKYGPLKRVRVCVLVACVCV